MPMQLRLTISLGVILLACACHRSTAPEETFDVYTPGNTFSPFSARVSVGTVVRFNIYGDDHNVIFSHTVAGSPADINVVRDQVVSRTFTTKGTFSYSCTVHPGMNGEIVVQ